jgi:taurine dioxygenase
MERVMVVQALSRPAQLTITRLSGSLGAEIGGINLAEPIGADTMAELRAAFLEHSVLVFPGQKITPDQHTDFAALWGELHFMPTLHTRLERQAAIVEVNYRGARPTTDTWHSDMSMEERPPMASLLLAKETPPAGGDTMFASQYLAYDRLSEGMKSMLGSLRAVHDGAWFASAARVELSLLPTSVHPVVRTHPETGRKALYVNAFFTRHFENMTVEESAPLLQWLYAHCSQPNFTFRHRWSVGDLVMWDNRCVQHYAIADYDSTKRVMNRATVLGDKPS